MDATKIEQLNAQFREEAAKIANPKGGKLGIKAVNLYIEGDNELCIQIFEGIYSGYTAQRVIDGLKLAKEYDMKPCVELWFSLAALPTFAAS